jgi:predicted transport protein
MKTLSQTWFAEGYIDFEQKKYTLLAYLQEIHQHFGQQKLYPQLGDVILHYNNLVAFKQNKEFLQQQFPKKLTQLDIQKLELLYQSIIDDDNLMKELEEIIQFAIHKMNATIQDGTEIYEFVEDKLIIFPIGLLPLETKEGYFFLSDGKIRQTKVYQYRLSFFEKHDEKYRSIKTEFVAHWERNLANTYEHIKSELLRYRTQLPNPAVYSIETELSFPIEETLLPIAKRRLVKYISDAA